MLDLGRDGQPFPYDELNKGIREVVRRLRVAGFETCNSGDGQSKPEDERELHEPHVFCMAAKEDVIAKADALQALVASWQLARPFDVQANYVPADGKAIVMLLGIGDADLESGAEDDQTRA